MRGDTAATAAEPSCDAQRAGQPQGATEGRMSGYSNVRSREGQLRTVMSPMGRGLLIGHRRRWAGMLRIAVGRSQAAPSPSQATDLPDACRPEPARRQSQSRTRSDSGRAWRPVVAVVT